MTAAVCSRWEAMVTAASRMPMRPTSTPIFLPKASVSWPCSWWISISDMDTPKSQEYEGAYDNWRHAPVKGFRESRCGDEPEASVSHRQQMEKAASETKRPFDSVGSLQD